MAVNISRLRTGAPSIADMTVDNPLATRAEVYDSVGSNEGDFSKGLRSGFSNLSSGMINSEALRAETEGDMQEASRLRAQAAAMEQESAAYAPRVTSYQDVHGVGDAADYVQGAFGQGVASMAPALATALLLRGRGTGLLSKAPAALGTGAVGYEQMRGEAAGIQYNDPTLAATAVEDRDRAATIAGGAGALLEPLVPMGVAGAVLRAPAKTALGQVARQGATEAATETAQDAATQLANMQLDPNRKFDTSQSIDAALMGGIAGGTVAGTLTGASNLAVKPLELVGDGLQATGNAISDMRTGRDTDPNAPVPLGDGPNDPDDGGFLNKLTSVFSSPDSEYANATPEELGIPDDPTSPLADLAPDAQIEVRRAAWYAKKLREHPGVAQDPKVAAAVAAAVAQARSEGYRNPTTNATLANLHTGVRGGEMSAEVVNAVMEFADTAVERTKSAVNQAVRFGQDTLARRNAQSPEDAAPEDSDLFARSLFPFLDPDARNDMGVRKALDPLGRTLAAYANKKGGLDIEDLRQLASPKLRMALDWFGDAAPAALRNIMDIAQVDAKSAAAVERAIFSGFTAERDVMDPTGTLAFYMAPQAWTQLQQLGPKQQREFGRLLDGLVGDDVPASRPGQKTSYDVKLQALADQAFGGDMKNTMKVLDSFRKQREADEAELDRDAQVDEDGIDVGEARNTGINEITPQEQGSFRSVNQSGPSPLRPFMVGRDDAELETTLAQARKTDANARVGTMLEHVEARGENPVYAAVRIRNRLDKEIAEDTPRDYEAAKRRVQELETKAEASRQLFRDNTGVEPARDMEPLNHADTKELRMLKTKLAAGDINPSMKRGRLPAVLQEREALRTISNEAIAKAREASKGKTRAELERTARDAAAKAILGNYKVVMGENITDAATDEELTSFRRLLDIQNKLDQDRRGDAAGSRMTFAMVDGKTLNLSATSMLYNSRLRNATDVQRLMDSISSVLAREDVAGLAGEISPDTIILPSRGERPALTWGDIDRKASKAKRTPAELSDAARKTANRLRGKAAMEQAVFETRQGMNQWMRKQNNGALPSALKQIDMLAPVLMHAEGRLDEMEATPKEERGPHFYAQRTKLAATKRVTSDALFNLLEEASPEMGIEEAQSLVEGADGTRSIDGEAELLTLQDRMRALEERRELLGEYITPGLDQRLLNAIDATASRIAELDDELNARYYEEDTGLGLGRELRGDRSSRPEPLARPKEVTRHVTPYDNAAEAAKQDAEEAKRLKSTKKSTMSPKKGRPSAQMDEAAVQQFVWQRVGKWVGVQLNQTYKQLGESSGTFEVSEQSGAAMIRVATNAVDILGVAAHETLHAFFHMLGTSPSERRLKKDLLAAASAPQVKAKLRELLEKHPGARAQIEGDSLEAAEERLAYVYQFHSVGLMPELGKTGTGIFGWIAKAIRKITGALSQEQKMVEVLTALDSGHFKDAKAQDTIAEVLADIKALTLGDRIEKVAKPLMDGAATVFVNAGDRLRRLDVPALEQLADMFDTPPGNEEGREIGFLPRRAQTVGQYRNKLAQALSGSTAEARKQAVKNLQAMKAPSTPLEHAMRKLLDELHEYATEAGVGELQFDPTNPKGSSKFQPLGKIEGYFPRNWDKNAIEANRPKFVAALSRFVGTKQAYATVDAIMNGTGAFDFAETEHDLGFNPFMSAVKDRKLKFITSATADQFTEFMKDDLTEIMTTYIEQIVHRGEYTRRFGVGGEKITAMMIQAQKQGATQDDLQMAAKATRAMEGTLGNDFSPRLKELQAAMMTAQNVILLPFALFSSLIDPLGVGMRSGEMTEAWKAFKTGVQGIMRSLSNKPDEREEMAKMIGIIDDSSMLDAMGMTYNSMHMSRNMRKVNQMFFKYNGMELWNRRMRLAAFEAGQRFIVRNAGNDRYMSELGLTAADLAAKQDGGLAVSREEIALYIKHAEKGRDAKGQIMSKAQIEAEAIRREKLTHQALVRFVDGAVLRPNGAQRPIWGSDPRFQLIFHLKQFTFSFHNTIMKRVGAEMKHGNSYPVWVLLSYVPFMLAADLLRGSLTGTGQTGGTMIDMLARATERSGIMGTGAFAADVAGDMSSGKLPGSSLLGPTYDHLQTLVSGVMGNKSLGDVAARSLPGGILFR